MLVSLALDYLVEALGLPKPTKNSIYNGRLSTGMIGKLGQSYCIRILL